MAAHKQENAIYTTQAQPPKGGFVIVACGFSRPAIYTGAYAGYFVNVHYPQYMFNLKPLQELT